MTDKDYLQLGRYPFFRRFLRVEKISSYNLFLTATNTFRSEDSRSFSSKSPLLSRDNGISKRSLSEHSERENGSTAEIQSELMTLAQEMRSLVRNLEKTTKTIGTQTESLNAHWVSSPSII